MLNSLFVKISSIAFAVGVAILGFFHLQVMQPPVHLGVAIPNVAQFFQDSLASSITSSQTTMTLVTGNDQSGNPLVGFFGFVIDEGTSLQEVVTATASGTTITAMTRGLDPIKGLTATTALQFAHRRGASVKITTSPWILVVNQILGGSSTLPASLQYAGHPVAPASTTLEDKSYVDSVATSGAAVAGIGTKGLVAVTTPLGATSTADGIGFDFNVIPAVYYSATSSATTTVVMTGGAGTIQTAFIAQNATSTYNFLGNVILASSTSITMSTATTTATTVDVFNLLPAGVIQMYSSSTAPAGWLLCDGTSYTTSTYPRLWTVIQYTFGGSASNFNVPNMQGRFPAGPSSTLSATIGATGGATSTNISVNSQQANGQGTGGGGSGFAMWNGVAGTSLNSTGTNSIIPPYLILNYIIKY